VMQSRLPAHSLRDSIRHRRMTGLRGVDSQADKEVDANRGWGGQVPIKMQHISEWCSQPAKPTVVRPPSSQD